MSLLLTRYNPSDRTVTRPPRVAPIPIPAFTAVESEGDPFCFCDEDVAIGLVVGVAVVYTVAAAMLEDNVEVDDEGSSERGKLALGTD